MKAYIWHVVSLSQQDCIRQLYLQYFMQKAGQKTSALIINYIQL